MLVKAAKNTTKKTSEMVAKCDLSSVCHRLHRVNGQVKAVERMLNEQRDFLDILQQLVAARQALDKIAVMVLESAARGCLKKTERQAPDELNRIISALFKTV